MKCLILVTILMFVTNWKTAYTRYIPINGLSRRWSLPRNTGRFLDKSPWQQGRQWIHGRLEPSRLAAGNRHNGWLTRASSHSSLPLGQLNDARTAVSPQYLRTHNIQSSRQTGNSIGSHHAGLTKGIAITSTDDEHSITLTHRHVRPRFAGQRTHMHSITGSGGFKTNNMEGTNNSGLHVRMNFLGKSRNKSKRPHHNIVIRTKSGRKIRISHSMDHTNIILKTKSRGDSAQLDLRPPATATKHVLNETTNKNITQHPDTSATHKDVGAVPVTSVLDNTTEDIPNMVNPSVSTPTVNKDPVPSNVTNVTMGTAFTSETHRVSSDKDALTSSGLDMISNEVSATLSDKPKMDNTSVQSVDIKTLTKTPQNATLQEPSKDITDAYIRETPGFAIPTPTPTPDVVPGSNLLRTTPVGTRLSLTSSNTVFNRPSNTINIDTPSQAAHANNQLQGTSQDPKRATEASKSGEPARKLDDQSEVGKPDDVSRDSSYLDNTVEDADGQNMDDNDGTDE